MSESIVFEVLPGRFSVARLPAGAPLPEPPLSPAFWSLTVTEYETSIVCAETEEPSGARVEPGWRALHVIGQLDFTLVGIVRDFTTALADAGVSVFVVSTFDTDYVLVKESQVVPARAALQRAGYTVTGEL